MLQYTATKDDFVFNVFTFGVPVLILGLTHNIVVRFWVVLYITSIWLASYLSNTDISALWIILFSFFVISTLLLVTIAVSLSPIQRLLLMPFLQKTDRQFVDEGIDSANTYVPSGKEDDIDIDIVAVNGLGAHSEWTWRAKAPSQATGKKYVAWLQEILPKSAPHARIMSFRQDSSYLVNAPNKTIRECGQQLLDGLNRVRTTDQQKKRPILLIGHSFGGIVVKQALVLAAKEGDHSPSHTLFQSTCGVLFLGTPHDGSWPSAIGKAVINFTYWMRSSSSIMDAMGYQSTQLHALDRDFADIYTKEKRITCIYETKKTYLYGILPILVVDERSATISGRRRVQLNTDHSGLNKFVSENSNCRIVIGEIKQMIDDITEQDDILKCLESLRPVDCCAILHMVSQPVRNTCDWIREEIDRFCLGPPISTKALVISGGPGTGKSVLSRFILEYLEDKPVEVAYFTFREHNDVESQAAPAIRTLVHQMLAKDHKLYRYIKGYYSERLAGGHQWTLDLLWEVFEEMISADRSKRTIILIDALNECGQATRKDLIQKLSSNPDITKHFLITTQRFPDFSDHFPAHNLIDVDSRNEVRRSVEILIDDQVGKYFATHKFEPHVREDVLLVINRLKTLSSSSAGHILKELKSLPRGLISTYEALFRVQLEEHGKAIRQKLPWILYACRLLKVEELRDALAMQDYGSEGRAKSFEDWRSSDIPGDLDRNFGTLVTIDRSTLEVRVRFFHDSLKGALLGTEDPRSEELTIICKSSKEEHAEIGSVCLDYLVEVKVSEDPPQEIFKRYPFLEYAAQRWPDHAREAGARNPKILNSFRKLATSAPNMKLAFRIFSQTTGYIFPDDMSSLQIAAYMGLEWLAIELIEDGANIHQTTKWKQHVLHRASGSGSESLLKLLLGKGIEVDVRDDAEQTGLHYAAQRGQARMVDILIKKGLQVNEPGRQGQTPLHYAASGKHLDVIRILLNANADPRMTDKYCQTPLQRMHACHRGKKNQVFYEVESILLKAENPGL
ncbi:MAG: hypothetical protein M1840_000717 [Geoglossum simile]|nr:MAG: hypothetical protein M1840_000717 [Geoglossum simile]